MFNIKKYMFLLTTIVTLTVTIVLSIPVCAWTSSWIIWEDPQPVYYSKDSSASTNTKAAWDFAVSTWNNAQSKVDLWSGAGGDIYLTYVNNSGVEWDGISYKYDYDDDDYLDYVVSYMNQYFTDSQEYSDENKRRSVSAHEVGHAMGLGEGNYEDTLMERYTDVRYGTYTIYTPQQDDINGINTLYYDW